MAVNDIPVNISRCMLFEVGPEHCISKLDDRLPGALATHVIVEWMETVAGLLVQPHLPEGSISVGRAVEVEYNALVPVGSKVTIEAQLNRVEGRHLSFILTAKDQMQLFAIAKHERVVMPLAAIESQLLDRANRTGP